MTTGSANLERELKLLLSKRENLFSVAQILYDLIGEIDYDLTELSLIKARYEELPTAARAFSDTGDRINDIKLSVAPESKVDAP